MKKKKTNQSKLKSVKEIERQINVTLKHKYRTDEHTYDVKIVDEIIYNESTRIVAQFKDFLILDDNSEFLRR